MSDNKTCGPLYLEGLTKYAQGDTAYSRIYAAGFVNGQAEKVYLGACPAAMFRPSHEKHDLVVEIACEAAERYGLHVFEYQDEIWVCRDLFVATQVDVLNYLDRDTARWHNHRAWLCGIPGREVDPEFHLRKGYGERCDGS